MKVRPDRHRPRWYRAEFTRDGKRHQFHEQHENQRAAGDAATAWKARILQGEDPERKRDRLRVAGVIKIGLEESKDQNRPRTYATRKSQAAALLRHLGDIPAARLTGHDLRQYKAARLNEGVRGPGINREISFLARAWHLAAIEGALGHPVPTSPSEIWEPLEETPFDPHIASIEERNLLLARARDGSYPARFYAFVALGVCHGLRWSEALTLDWSDVSLKEGVIRLRAQACKGKRPRLIVLDETTTAALREIGPGVGGVFGHSNGPTFKFRRPWRRLLRESGIQTRYHDLRHTHATEVTGNRDLYAAQLILGHADPRTTQRYVHLSEGAVRRITEKVAR